MKIEFEVSEAALVREVQSQVETAVKKQLLIPTRIAPIIEKQARECIEAMDLRGLIKQEIDSAVEEIVRNAVGGQLRGIAKTIVQQEIEKVRAAAMQPATVRDA